MNFFRVLRVGFQVARHAIVEAHAEGEQQVGLLNGFVDPGFAVHAHHAQVQHVRSRQSAEPEQRQRHGNARSFGERLHLFLGARDQNPVPGENQRPLRAADQFQRLFVLLLRRREIGPVAAHLRRGAFPIEFAEALLRVLGDVDQHRPGAPGLGDVHRFANGGRDFVRASDEIVVLGDRQRDAGDIGFLKRVRAEQLAADLSGDADDGRGVHHGRGDAGDHVRRAGTGGCDGDAHFAGGARVAVGHVRGALLVTHQDVANRAVPQRVVGRQNRAARIAEDGLYALAFQALPKDPRTGHRLLVAGFVTGISRLAATHRRLPSEPHFPVKVSPQKIKPTLPASLAGGFRELLFLCYSAQ